MSELMIRPAVEQDLPAINAIYNYYVLNSTATYQLEPETEADRLAWFHTRTAAHPVTVALIGTEIVGWASLSTYKARVAYRHTVENSVYLHPDWLRRGIGRALMHDIMARATELGHHTILAVISADQDASIRLHETLGFTKAGHFRELGYKFDRWLDVVCYQKMLEPPDTATPGVVAD